MTVSAREPVLLTQAPPRLSLRSALAELRRLRRENGRLAAQLADIRRLAAALADAIDHETELRLRCQWFHDGWLAAELAHADDYERGYVDGVLDRKNAGIDVYRALQLEQRRWDLRGQKRTRQTFSQPHPHDRPVKGNR